MAKIGDKFLNYRKQEYTVLEILGDSAKIIFTNTQGVRNVHITKLYMGTNVKDYFERTVCGVGYIGCDPKELRPNSKYRPIYKSWVRMLQRV